MNVARGHMMIHILDTWKYELLGFYNCHLFIWQTCRNVLWMDPGFSFSLPSSALFMFQTSSSVFTQIQRISSSHYKTCTTSSATCNSSNHAIEPVAVNMLWHFKHSAAKNWPSINELYSTSDAFLSKPLIVNIKILILCNKLMNKV